MNEAEKKARQQEFLRNNRGYFPIVESADGELEMMDPAAYVAGLEKILDDYLAEPCPPRRIMEAWIRSTPEERSAAIRVAMSTPMDETALRVDQYEPVGPPNERGRLRMFHIAQPPPKK